SAHFLYTEQNLLVWDYGNANLNGRYSLFYSAIPSSACQGDNDCLNEWTHIVLVSDGSTKMNVYINGQALTEKNSADHPNMELTGLYIGKAKFDNTGSSFPADWIFKGNLDEFMIYNQVLTNDEINRIYNIQRSKFGV
ncbi:MAG: LamG-like jellyroll fold domain-containing protein, partial [Nanoarchaeota archaeon]